MLIKRLSVRGPRRTDATVAFQPGANVVRGLSDTGKTYVFQCLDFALGGSATPKPIVEASGYENVLLEIKHDSGTLTIDRRIGDGRIRIHRMSIQNLPQTSSVFELVGESETVDNISPLLLQISNIGQQHLRKSGAGETQRLSFRNIAHLCVVDEDRISDEIAPLYEDGSPYTRTFSKSVFTFVVSGVGGEIQIPKDDLASQRTAWTAKNQIYDALIADTEQRLTAISERTFSTPLTREAIEERLAEARTRLQAVAQETDSLSADRITMVADRDKSRSRAITVAELVSQFRVLREHYHTDLSRLEFIEESDHYFQQLSKIKCPLCGNDINEHTTHDLCEPQDESLPSVRQACSREAAKILTLMADLDQTVANLQSEGQMLQGMVEELSARIRHIDEEITTRLLPRQQEQQSLILDLVARRDVVVEEGLLAARLEQLREQREALGNRPSRPKPSNGSANTSLTIEPLLELIAEELRSYHVDASVVTFDGDFNLHLDGKPYRSFGKGMRGIINSAYVISLMNYARENRRPHPYFVILDSPLTAYRGKEMPVSDEEVADDIKAAFYTRLSNTPGDRQIIVLDQEDVPSEPKSRISATEFSKSHQHGRYGFLPDNIPTGF